MSIYQTPGVYREDVFPEPPPELRTGVPAFLGLASKGKMNDPVRLVLWPQFEEQFGLPDKGGFLADAVRGFFENGGRLCYVIRLDDQPSFEDALAAGLQVLESLDTIDLICVPDLATLTESDTIYRLQRQVLAHCHKLGDRFAILDSRRGDDLEKIKKRPDELRQGGVSGTNGALYFPWIGLGALEKTGRTTVRYVPPCGHVAGVYAACDERVGVHKAPANEELAGVLDLQFNLTEAQQADLNPVGVNCLRAFPGRGIRVWGARTLAEKNSAWTYVNVRRLFLTAGRWIERAVAGVVFEPNDLRLWLRLERELRAYFSDLFQRGALKGGTEEEAFYVKCDAETNPPEVREAGLVVTEIGLAPASPNEFVVVRLIHGASGVTIE
jgi:phage tail sheath protein FI